ncbi:MAG: hypothetical protein QXK69_12525 [Candidatus Caldarchaeum sp.]
MESDLHPGSLFVVRHGSGLICLADLERAFNHDLDGLSHVMKFMFDAFRRFEKSVGCCAVGKAYGRACYVFVGKGFDRVLRKHGRVLSYGGVEFVLMKADAQQVLQLVGFLDRVDEELVRRVGETLYIQNSRERFWKKLAVWR